VAPYGTGIPWGYEGYGNAGGVETLAAWLGVVVGGGGLGGGSFFPSETKKKKLSDELFSCWSSVMTRTIVERYTPNAFSAILHRLLDLMLLYCRAKPISCKINDTTQFIFPYVSLYIYIYILLVFQIKIVGQWGICLVMYQFFVWLAAFEKTESLMWASSKAEFKLEWYEPQTLPMQGRPLVSNLSETHLVIWR